MTWRGCTHASRVLHPSTCCGGHRPLCPAPGEARTSLSWDQAPSYQQERCHTGTEEQQALGPENCVLWQRPLCSSFFSASSHQDKVITAGSWPARPEFPATLSELLLLLPCPDPHSLPDLGRRSSRRGHPPTRGWTLRESSSPHHQFFISNGNSSA